MDKKDLRIIFMGTPEFAVGSLKKLVENGYNVVAVVTQPDKPVGRHHDTLRPSAVKVFATEHGIPVLQPANSSRPPHVAGSDMGNASLRNIQRPRSLVAAIPWSSAHQLGGHQW